MNTDESRLESLQTKFAEVFGDLKRDWLAVSAPGRVNLIGEHTDYNEGYVFPVAIDRTVDVLVEESPEATVEIYASNLKDKKTFFLSDTTPRSQHTWLEYPRGVISLLRKKFPKIGGMRMVLQGDVPQGAGLSSSAAVEVATAYALRELFRLPISVKDMALLCREAEHQYSGVNCGIMDQFASALCEAGCALLLDCRNQETKAVPLPVDLFSLVIINSMVKRGLVDSEYNTRRKECEEAVGAMKRVLKIKRITSLRDVDLHELDLWGDALSDKPLMRARHVISENARVLAAVDALQAEDMEDLGNILYDGHSSLQADYEVSIRELDLLVGFARQSGFAYGARMTGAGFGGCTVNLVKPGSEEHFIEVIKKEYHRATKLDAEFYVCNPSQGARRIDIG